jgi:hypothetical protein
MYIVVSEEYAASIFRIELAYKPSFLPETTNFNPKNGGNTSLKCSVSAHKITRCQNPENCNLNWTNLN